MSDRIVEVRLIINSNPMIMVNVPSFTGNKINLGDVMYAADQNKQLWYLHDSYRRRRSPVVWCINGLGEHHWPAWRAYINGHKVKGVYLDAQINGGDKVSWTYTYPTWWESFWGRFGFRGSSPGIRDRDEGLT